MEWPIDVTPHELVSSSLREHQSAFDAFVRGRVHPDDVDDIIQLGRLRAIERASTLDDPDRVMAWLYSIHRNLITDVMRKNASERKHVDASAELPELSEMVMGELCRCSVSQVQRLRPSYATILTLVDTEGLQLTEAARKLDVSVNNATVRLHRARKALREEMLEHCGVTDARECASCRCIDDNCCVA